MPENAEAIRDSYAAAGVLLSLSGHYHAGQAPTEHRGTVYRTTPSLCVSPYRYDLLTLHGRDVHIEPRQLLLPTEPRLIDTHAHTEFAYCGKTVAADLVLARAGQYGLAEMCLVEHSPQLYLAREDFWQARHIFEPDLWRRGYGHERMAGYRALTDPLGVRVGFEVELDVDGRLMLRDEDRRPDDLLVGAIHWLTVRDDGLTDAAATTAFLRDCEGLCADGVDILAHPWRYFGRAKRPIPVDAYATLADMLAETDTAAEINFHTNRPDARFFELCIERGVKIATGSDAHWLFESAQFTPHLRTLIDAVGSSKPTELTKVLYRP